MTTDWRPTASPEMLRRRAELLAQLRDFFRRRGVLEVDTPQLAHAGVSAPALHNLRAGSPEERQADTGFLQTSPEYAMKRLLAAGSGDIYQLSHAFRAGEQGRRHNLEFMLLEWYRVGWDYRRLMDEVAELLGMVLAPARPPLVLSFAEAFRDYLDIDPFEAGVAELRAACEEAGLAVSAAMAACAERDTWLELMLSSLVEPRLPDDRLVFVHAWPASQAALARIDADRTPPVAQRFEVYYRRMELANGYQELTDAAEQRRRFLEDNRQRRARGLPEVAPDERLLAALDAGLPPCSGVALGVDRLLMLASGADSIEAVLPFPWPRA